ncbi:MAG: hypothetical protein AAFV88_05160 [Planctomycetota bacterium]
MSKYLAITLLIVFAHCEIGNAQGVLRGKRSGDGRGNPAALRQISDDSTDRRQDVEGTIWEFKVLDPKEKDPKKQTIMTGQIRIKQSSVFSVGKPKVMNEPEKEGANAAKDAGNVSKGSGLQGKLKDRLSQKMNQPLKKDSGGERIGDVSKGGSNKYKYEFDQDDEYPLSGLVNVEPDKEKKNGVWSGNYEEFSGGKKVKRWRFEMRKIEE